MVNVISSMDSQIAPICKSSFARKDNAMMEDFAPEYADSSNSFWDDLEPSAKKSTGSLSMTFDPCIYCTDRPSVRYFSLCFFPYIYLFRIAREIFQHCIVAVDIVFIWKSLKMMRKFRFSFRSMTEMVR